MKNEDNYITIRIPRQLAEEIDKIIQSGTLGYTSRAEMVKEALRLRLQDLKTNYTQTQNPSSLTEEVVFLNRKKKRVAEVHLEFEFE